MFALPLLAMIPLLDLLGKSLTAPLVALFEALFSAGMLEMAMTLLMLMGYAIWLILDFAWGDLGWLILTIVGWLLCG